jgi:hypothetical protein
VTAHGIKTPTIDMVKWRERCFDGDEFRDVEMLAALDRIDNLERQLAEIREQRDGRQ